MPIVELKLPPGIVRKGTEYRSKGRYYDGNLVRWYEDDIRPMGGWIAHSATKVVGSARAILPWQDNTATRWIGVGTESHLYVYDRTGLQYDITPTAFTTGRASASTGGGYGAGFYGVSAYGTPRIDSGLVQDATVWSLDTLGGKLLGCNADDGKIYEWDNNTGHLAAVVTNAPTSNRALVVTEQGAVMCLGAGGDPRMVKWSNLYDETTWAPAVTNQAGFQRLQTQGRLMCARRTKGHTILFTDLDVFSATYQGPPYIYGFQRIGSGCGIVSQQGVAVADTVVAWMGRGGFWTYDGFVQPLESEVDDYVFSDFNRSQQSKVFAVHNPVFGEVTWGYPSSASNEIDRYVRWNYRESHWAIGKLVRLCGAEQGVFSNPLMVGPDGTVYQHETGYAYDGVLPYAETGPLELGSGQRFVVARSLIPDERTLGQVTATFLIRNYPNATQWTKGPYKMEDPTSLRFTGRQVSVRYDGVVAGDWRIGVPRVDIVPGAQR